MLAILGQGCAISQKREGRSAVTISVVSCWFSATRDVGGFLIRLADQSEEKSASLSTAVVQNYEFDDARPTLANPFETLSAIKRQ
jgi:hypothetical protein